MSNAKAVLEWLSGLLDRELGISLNAETLRQAKFNTPSASGPLWRALHDATLLKLWRSDVLPHSDKNESTISARRGIRELWGQIESDEGITSGQSFMPREGALMTLHYLAAWGCPSRLTSAIKHDVTNAPEAKDGRVTCVAWHTSRFVNI